MCQGEGSYPEWFSGQEYLSNWNPDGIFQKIREKSSAMSTRTLIGAIKSFYEKAKASKENENAKVRLNYLKVYFTHFALVVYNS